MVSFHIIVNIRETVKDIEKKFNSKVFDILQYGDKEFSKETVVGINFGKSNVFRKYFIAALWDIKT